MYTEAPFKLKMGHTLCRECTVLVIIWTTILVCFDIQRFQIRIGHLLELVCQKDIQAAVGHSYPIPPCRECICDIFKLQIASLSCMQKKRGGGKELAN